MTQISLDYRFENGRYVFHIALKPLSRTQRVVIPLEMSLQVWTQYGPLSPLGGIPP